MTGGVVAVAGPFDDEAGRRVVTAEAVLARHVDCGVIIGSVFAAVATGMDRDKVAEDHRSLPAEVVAGTGADVREVLVGGDPREILVKASEDAALLVVGRRDTAARGQPRRWKVPGVWPKARRKTSMNALAEDHPQRWATVVTGTSSASIRRAW